MTDARTIIALYGELIDRARRIVLDGRLAGHEDLRRSPNVWGVSPTGPYYLEPELLTLAVDGETATLRWVRYEEQTSAMDRSEATFPARLLEGE